jgi:hypothetical protein
MPVRSLICSFRLLGLAAAALLATACGEGGDEHDDPTPEFVEDGPALETAEGGIRGYALQAPLRGIVKIAVTGQADAKTGLQLGPDLVVTSNRWLGHATAPANVRVTALPGTASAQSTVAAGVNATDFFPAAVVHHADFAANASTLYPIDERAPADLTNGVVRCYEYVGDRLNYADMRLGPANADGSMPLSSAFATGDTVEDADSGAPCLDTTRWTAVGMVDRAVNGTVHLRRYAPMRPFLDGQRTVAALRNDARNARASFYTVAPNGTRMCLDIPFGSPFDGETPTVYPCHYGPAQRFWLDQSVDANRVRLVSDSSGRCLDMPSGSTVSGTNYQQFGCHLGFNQRFTYTLWNDAAGGVKIAATHAPGQSLCLSVEGGPTAVSHAVEQRTCTGSQDQRWFPRWVP